MQNAWLFSGGVLSAVAALLHIGCIFGGPSWYRFFGAGEQMARMAERGSPTPAISAGFIAAILFVWSAYAFSGAGLLPRAPLLRIGLVVICGIYLLRAFAFPLMLIYLPGRSASFIAWSSAIVLIYGVVHLIGLWSGWTRLAPPSGLR